MMKKKLFALLWGIVSLGTFAQNAQPQMSDTLKMSLQDCIDYALKNNISIKNSKLDEQIARSKVGEVRAIGLPQIYGSIGYQHNLKLRDIYGVADSTSFLAPRVFTPYQVTGTDFSGNTRPFTAVEQGALTVPEGKVYKTANFFQLPNTLDASLNFSQIIFSGSYIVGLQAANTYKELSAKATDQTMIQTKASVTKSYYLALINLERMSLFDANILRVDSLLSQTQKLQKSGFVEQIDVDRIEVTLNNLITERQKFENLMLLSNVLLKYQMGMPMESNIVLMDELSAMSFDENSLSKEKVNYNNRVEYLQLKTSKKLAELDLKNNQWANLPSLAFSGNLGVFTSNKDLNVFSNENFAEKNKMWSDYGLLQLGLNIPLYGGGSRMYKTQQANLTVKKTENSIKDLERAIDLQTKQSEINFNNSIKSLETQKRNMKLAENVTIISQKKYKQGVGSNLEITTAESALKEAQVNYYNSLFDAINSKVEYDLATGTIK